MFVFNSLLLLTAHFLGLCMAVLCFSGYCLNFWSAWRLPVLFGKKVADNSLVFASHSCRAWFLYVCFPGAYKISAVMQGAPPDQMGASYPHMFLILLLLHGANAASKAPAGPKWQTLSGILFLFCFFCRYSFTYQGFQAFVLFYLPFQDSSSLMCNCSAMSPSC